MPKIKPGSVKFEEAIDFYRNKLQIPTRYWDEMLGTVHARAFTVAGAVKADLLNDLHSDVQAAIKDGESIGQFRKRFDKTVEKHGWKYKGKRGWRTRIIYDTNLRTARMAGRWQQIQRTKKNRPYLQYLTAGDTRVRPEHAAWNDKVLLIDDVWWDTHYPPNGWGCRCTVRTLSQRQLERADLTVSKAPPLEESERVNVRTGEVYGDVPKGIDVGWNYNVGKAWLGPDIDFGIKLLELPHGLRNQALKSAKSLTPNFQHEFSPWINKLIKSKKPLGEIKTVGYLTPGVIDELTKRKLAPSTAVITVSDRDLIHAIRDAKDGKHLPLDLLRGLPDELLNAKAVLFDKRNPALLFVFDNPGKERDGKLVVHVNYKTKFRTDQGERFTRQSNAVVTTGQVPLVSLKNKSFYEVIEGDL